MSERDSEANRFSARAARYARVGANVGGVAARIAGTKLFGLEGRKAGTIADELFTKWKVHTVAIEREGRSGEAAAYNHVRVTPNVYTTFQELDRLVEAVHAMAR